MEPETLYIVMPAYNEADTIADVVAAWYPVLSVKSPASRLVIADSGSTDDTHRILLELKKKYPQLSILEGTLKQHGPKLIALYRYSIDSGADYIFQTDSDGQTDPAEFEKFWEQRHICDAICGNRTSRQDGASRAFVEKIVCMLLRLYFGVKVPDANAPFRLMKASVLKKYVGRFEDDYALPNIMLTAFFSYYGESLSFVPISFKPRQGGVNSVNIPKIIKTGWRALGDFRRFRREMKR